MAVINDNEGLKLEDQIIIISEGLAEIESYCNIISSAITNEFDPPRIEDLDKSIYILKEYIIKVKNDVLNHINYCETLGIFNNSLNDKSKA